MNRNETLAALEAQLDAETLDDLLIRWHHWQDRAVVTRGFAPRAAVAGEYRTSRQYDDVSGALDDAIDDQRSRAVDFAVQHLAEPWRSAVYVEARNLVTGRSVWDSPRLPGDPAERGQVVAEARSMLASRLRAAGVMGG